MYTQIYVLYATFSYYFYTTTKTFTMKRKHEFRPIYLPVGSQLPINVYIYFSVGKQPLVRVYTAGVNGGKVYSPLIVPETFADSEGYCERILLQPTSGDPFVTTEEFWIYINPQDVK